MTKIEKQLAGSQAKEELRTKLAAFLLLQRNTDMEDMIKHMVNRFLGWRLPDNFSPDAGISFKSTSHEGTPFERKNEPIGTNLFDATQAEAMVRHMLEGLS